MMLEALVSVVGGYLLHQLRLITGRMPNGWRQLTSYAMGVVGSLPFVGLFEKRLKAQKHKCFIAYVLGFLFVGVGVSIGWLVDTMNDD